MAAPSMPTIGFRETRPLPALGRCKLLLACDIVVTQLEPTEARLVMARYFAGAEIVCANGIRLIFRTLSR